MSREALGRPPSDARSCAAALWMVGAHPRAGLRASDDGSFVLKVIAGGQAFLVPFKDSEVRDGKIAAIIGDETGSYLGSGNTSSALLTELVLNLRRSALDAISTGSDGGGMPAMPRK